MAINYTTEQPSRDTWTRLFAAWAKTEDQGMVFFRTVWEDRVFISDNYLTRGSNYVYRYYVNKPWWAR